MGEAEPLARRAGAGALPDWLQERLLGERVVMLRGVLNDEVATGVATQLMALDAWGDEPITLHVGGAEGTLEAAFTLMATIDALGVPVHGLCAGQAEGPLLAVLAVCHHRRAAPHTRLRLSVPPIEARGTPAELLQAARRREQAVARFVERIARATRQPAELVEVDLRAERCFDPPQALAYRLIDEVWERPERP